jgi:hypothetical protein
MPSKKQIFNIANSEPPVSDIDTSMGDDSDESSAMSTSDTSEGNSIKSKIFDCLQVVTSAGNFAACFNEPAFINPGLNIDNLGALPLPLVQRDADAIIQLCKRAPFGQNEKTIVDTNVRRTWELDANQFKCQNPAWPAYLKGLVERTVAELGAQGDIDVQPYKLLIYEKGAFFKRHRDTEKVPGMFGTLVISLPSPHEGGEVHLSHSGEGAIFKTAATSAYDLCALSWYSDVKHEIKPITSGNRLVLTYNLVTHKTTSSTLKPSAQSLAMDRNTLAKCLRHWLTNYPEEDRFIHVLGHQYTNNSLCLSNLKGNDALIVRYLQQVCSTNDVYVFLASMTRTVEPDDEYGESFSDEIALESVFTLEGTQLGSGLRIETEQLTEEQNYSERDPDSEDEGEYTGNEGMASTERYHDSVVLLVPKTNFCTVFLPEANDAYSFLNAPLSKILEFVLSDLLLQPEATITRNQAKIALDLALNGLSKGTTFNNDDPLHMEEVKCILLKLCDVLDEPVLMAQVVDQILTSKTSPSDLMKEAIEKMVDSLHEDSTKKDTTIFWDTR